MVFMEIKDIVALFSSLIRYLLLENFNAPSVFFLSLTKRAWSGEIEFKLRTSLLKL